MQTLQSLNGESKGNGAALPSKRHDPASIAPLPTALTSEQRKSLFALQIWNVEHKPSFARSSIYGYAR